MTWKDLEGLPFVAFGPNTTVRRLIGTVEGLPTNVSEPAYEVADVITMEALLEADLGITAGFKLGAYRGRDRKLMFRPLVEPALGRTISLITHAERALSPAASAGRQDDHAPSTPNRRLSYRSVVDATGRLISG